ncbi:MAG: DUF58 domain-containing protein [Planctomycetota bacterium]
MSEGLRERSARGRGRRRLRLGRAAPAYVVGLSGAAFAASYTQANLLFWAMGVLLGALLVSTAYAVLTMRRLELRRAPGSVAVVGEALRLRYRVVNRSWWPVFAVTVHEVLSAGERGAVEGRGRRVKGRPVGWLSHLVGDEPTVGETVCWPLRRGELAFEGVELRSAFPFGLIDCRVRFDRPASVTVLPQLYRLRRQAARRALGAQPGQNQPRVLSPGAGSDLYELRAYRAGDPPASLDWKRSAKTGRLISRRYAKPEPPQVWIGVDLSRPGAAGETAAAGDARAQERAVSLAASLACEAFLAGMWVGLSVAGAPGHGMAPRGGPEHRRRLLKSLAMLDVERLGRGGPMSGRPTVRVVADPARGGRGGRHGAPSLTYLELPALAVEVDPAELLAPIEGSRRYAPAAGGESGPEASA